MRYWTDGACFPNPGCGGWAVVDENGNVVARGSDVATTNNRMELMAVLVAMKHSPVGGMIYSDSRYSVDAVTKWYRGWVSKGKLADKKNVDLIAECHNIFVNKGLSLSWMRRDTHEMNQVADDVSKEMASEAYREKMGLPLPDYAWDSYSYGRL